MIRWLMPLALLGCTPPATRPYEPVPIADELRSCPPSPRLPAAPPRIRTVDRLGDYTRGLERTVQQYAAAYATCEWRLQTTIDTIEAHDTQLDGKRILETDHGRAR
jgi:hypothetical protein